MGETPAKQEYIFAPADPIYHIALSDGLTRCGLWIHGEPEQRRRRDDRRLASEKPIGQFTALCSQCERKATSSSGVVCAVGRIYSLINALFSEVQ